MNSQYVEELKAENQRLWTEYECLERLCNEARTRWCDHHDKFLLVLEREIKTREAQPDNPEPAR